MDRLAALDAAVADIRPHAHAWIELLERYVSSLPPDGPVDPHTGESACDRSYAEHELRAMRRDLAALLAV